MNYDIIGDIHGHADALVALLAKLGYREREGVWRQAGRQVIFVGDFIDRGPGQLATVEIVRRMVDAGSAIAVMGNHEFNAIGWYLPDPDNPGEYLRPHSPKNHRQTKAFLSEVAGTLRHEEIINWFLSLPLWLDLAGLRVVHACWHPGYMDFLAPRLTSEHQLTRELMVEASKSPENEAEVDTPEPTVFKGVEALLKGMEIPLPKPHAFRDKDGHQRNRVRVRWWDSGAVTYREAALVPEQDYAQLPGEPIPKQARLGYTSAKSVFFGHYWFTGTPRRLAEQVACVDYSVAKHGKLVAYRWDGEPVLDSSKFKWVDG